MAKAGGKRSISKTYSLPVDLAVRVADTAKADGISVSQIVRNALALYFKDREEAKAGFPAYSIEGSLKTIVSAGIAVQRPPCPVCRGRGFVTITLKDSSSSGICSMCAGSGYDPNYRELFDNVLEEEL